MYHSNRLVRFPAKTHSTGSKLGRLYCHVLIFALVAGIAPSPTPTPDYTGVFVGAGITLCVGVLAAITSLLAGILSHRREIRAEQSREKRGAIERLVTVAQSALRACMMYRVEVQEEHEGKRQLDIPRAWELIDEAFRISILQVPECSEAVKHLEDAVTEFTTLEGDNFDRPFDSELHQKRLRPVIVATFEIAERCHLIAKNSLSVPRKAPTRSKFLSFFSRWI